MKYNELILKHSTILWNYHKKEEELHSCDFILALGSHDIRPAGKAADIFLDGLAKFIVCTGGFGKITKESWAVPEADKFFDLITNMGVPKESILIENKAANTGENFSYTKALFAQRGIKFNKGIIVTKPYMCRRAYATGLKQWPEISWQVTSPKISFLDYPNKDVSLEKTINLMVGDLQRIKVYAEKGFQVQQDIPREVWKSFDFLVDQGFTDYLLEEGD